MVEVEQDYSWVQKIMVIDAVDKTAVEATLDNPGWELLHVGTGKGGQTTLTFGWPARQEEKKLKRWPTIRVRNALNAVWACEQ